MDDMTQENPRTTYLDLAGKVPEDKRVECDRCGGWSSEDEPACPHCGDGVDAQPHEKRDIVVAPVAVEVVEKTLEMRLVEALTDVTEYRKEDLDSLRPEEMCDRQWALTIHAARRHLLQQAGIVFQPSPEGVFRRATTAKQVTARAARERRAALKKLETATITIAAARTVTDDPQEIRRIEAMEVKAGNAIASAKSAMRSHSKPRPPGI